MTNTLTAELTRPIVGIENRTAQEVFDIMSDRIKRTSLPSPPVLGEAAKLRVGQVWKTRGGWIASVFAKSPFPEYPFTVGHNKGDVLKNYSANHRADGQRLDVESDDDLVELLSSPSDDDARRYIENWCPDHVKDYIASLSPLTNEPVWVTKPKCGVAGEISLPAMGLDYFYNPSDWEWTQNADDDSCIADWLSESMVDVMEIQTLIEGPLLFAANIPTKWDEEGEVTDSEVTYFDTEEDAKRALSAAIGELG